MTDDLNLQYRIRLPFNIILSFVRSALPPIAAYAYISAVYYAEKARGGEPVPGQALPRLKNARRFNAITFYITAALCIAVVCFYDTALRPALVRMDALAYIPGTPALVVAHRGYAAEADENTITRVSGTPSRWAWTTSNWTCSRPPTAWSSSRTTVPSAAYSAMRAASGRPITTMCASCPRR